jgi:L-asparagine transporter-like permease
LEQISKNSKDFSLIQEWLDILRDILTLPCIIAERRPTTCIPYSFRSVTYAKQQTTHLENMPIPAQYIHMPLFIATGSIVLSLKHPSDFLTLVCAFCVCVCVYVCAVIMFDNCLCCLTGKHTKYVNTFRP